MWMLAAKSIGSHRYVTHYSVIFRSSAPTFHWFLRVLPDFRTITLLKGNKVIATQSGYMNVLQKASILEATEV
jgi:hypothetical protein